MVRRGGFAVAVVAALSSCVEKDDRYDESAGREASGGATGATSASTSRSETPAESSSTATSAGTGGATSRGTDGSTSGTTPPTRQDDSSTGSGDGPVTEVPLCADPVRVADEPGMLWALEADDARLWMLIGHGEDEYLYRLDAGGTRIGQPALVSEGSDVQSPTGTLFGSELFVTFAHQSETGGQLMVAPATGNPDMLGRSFAISDADDVTRALTIWTGTNFATAFVRGTDRVEFVFRAADWTAGDVGFADRTFTDVELVSMVPNDMGDVFVLVRVRAEDEPSLVLGFEADGEFRMVRDEFSYDEVTLVGDVSHRRIVTYDHDLTDLYSAVLDGDGVAPPGTPTSVKSLREPCEGLAAAYGGATVMAALVCRPATGEPYIRAIEVDPSAEAILDLKTGARGDGLQAHRLAHFDGDYWLVWSQAGEDPGVWAQRLCVAA